MKKPKYTAFVVPDSGAVAIAHLKGDRIVFDALIDPHTGSMTGVPKRGASVKKPKRRRRRKAARK